jgi:hypothetical protein
MDGSVRSFSRRYKYNHWMPAPCVFVDACDVPAARAPGGADGARDAAVLCTPAAVLYTPDWAAVLYTPDWAASTLDQTA